MVVTSRPRLRNQARVNFEDWGWGSSSSESSWSELQLKATSIKSNQKPLVTSPREFDLLTNSQIQPNWTHPHSLKHFLSAVGHFLKLALGCYPDFLAERLIKGEIQCWSQNQCSVWQTSHVGSHSMGRPSRLPAVGLGNSARRSKWSCLFQAKGRPRAGMASTPFG